MWVMCYERSQHTQYGSQHYAGQTVTSEHPLIVLERWNKRYRTEAAERVHYHACIVVLRWYASLSTDEAAELVAAGLDISAQDREASL